LSLDPHPHPTTFGVFKPVDHVLLAFAEPAQADAAVAGLLADGFGHTDIKHYTPAAMLEQAARDLKNAQPLASLGQELNLVKAHLALAEQGHSFVLVHAPDAQRVEQVKQLALVFAATRAQRYGLLLIEELVEVGDSAQQVSESPARGLDMQAAVSHPPTSAIES
jgi:hypothetical protein